jgi:hypothetical protein
MQNINVTEVDGVNQMELGFAGRRAGRRSEAHHRRQRRAQRAHWWFQQMRRVVDRARDWQSAPPARPEQVYLSLVGRRNW